MQGHAREANNKKFSSMLGGHQLEIICRNGM